MPGSEVYCSACGNPLGNPEKVLHDPEGELLPELGPIENEDPHIKVIYRDTGMVTRCEIENQFTELTPEPPDGAGGEGGNPADNSGSSNGPQQQQRQENNNGRRDRGDEVFDLKEDKDALDILEEVVSNDAYGLNQGQINEVMDWGDIYDGHIPPDGLNDILQDMNGVSKQKASLMTKKYELKLTKHIREGQSEDTGPQLGLMGGGAAGGRTPSPRPPTPNKKQAAGGSPAQKADQAKKSKEQKQSSNDGPRRRGPPKSGRSKRKQRRQEAIDQAAEQFAHELARNMASDAGRVFQEGREIAITLFKKKAEKDPEWFFEKAEKWDMDLFDELMKESEAKANEESAPSVDTEVDDAVESIMNGGEDSTRTEEPTTGEPNTNPMSATPPPEPGEEDMDMDIDTEQEDVPADNHEDEFDDELDELMQEMEEQ